MKMIFENEDKKEEEETEKIPEKSCICISNAWIEQNSNLISIDGK